MARVGEKNMETRKAYRNAWLDRRDLPSCIAALGIADSATSHEPHELPNSTAQVRLIVLVPAPEDEVVTLKCNQRIRHEHTALVEDIGLGGYRNNVYEVKVK